MKLSSLIASRPVLVFFSLAIAVLLLPSIAISLWSKKAKTIEGNVSLNANISRSVLISEVQSIPKLLHPMNSSAENLARLLSLSINGADVSFQIIETKAAPSMFQAFSTIPLVSQISYIGLDGYFFSYYTADPKSKQTFAVYSNSSFSSNSSAKGGGNSQYFWYTQPVDYFTGMLYGEAVKSHPFRAVNTTWFQAALISSSGAYASLGDSWDGNPNSLFLNTAGIDGKAVISIGFPIKAITDFFTAIDLHGGSLYLATLDGEVLVNGIPNTQMVFANDSISFWMTKPNGTRKTFAGNAPCTPSKGTPSGHQVVDFGGTEYDVYCSQIEILRVQSVYALFLPHEGSASLVHRTSQSAFILLVVMIAFIIFYILSFVILMVIAARREMHLFSTLIRQKEATQQAERKSMNKSLAFASASHDIRASLAGITGLIEISYPEVAPNTDLHANLKGMQSCAQDLLGLLNSILDTSKIEAGKMQLEEEEFNVAQLLEQVVDLFYPVGVKKGIDVILDPYDESITKFPVVKGDRGKLKQLLCNLLSNAVKFTSEGHVSVRAWVQKPKAWVQKQRLESSTLASRRTGVINKYLSCFFKKNNEARNDMEAIFNNAANQNPNSMEFVFEVDDTGKGIPKEKHKSVFENFVQVKETALGEGGTGLGLGIVQSLVRLMGGEIGIINKEIGEKGTCFRFNVFLTPSNSSSTADARGENEFGGMNVNPSSSKLGILSSNPKLHASLVVLLIRNEERRRVSRKFMEDHGITVKVVQNWEHLHSVLRKIKSKQDSTTHSSSGKPDYVMSSRSDLSTPSSKDTPLSAMDGTDQKTAFRKKRSGSPGFVLLVIDSSAGPFPELCKVVAEFRSNLHGVYCRVVWLDKPTSRRVDAECLAEEGNDPDDKILLKPFHGSQLYQVINLLPEFGGEKVSSSGNHSQNRVRSSSWHGEEIQKEGSSGSEISVKTYLPPAAQTQTDPRNSPHPANQLVRQSEIQEEIVESSSQTSLSGKRILIAEDNKVLRSIAMAMLKRLGAIVQLCENGEEALEVVRKGLEHQTSNDCSRVLPYDYILMDCQMPVMNGYEATRQIRNVEKQYGVHIPIFALTANTADEARETIEAGMDYHLSKPLKGDDLMKAIQYIHDKQV